MKTTRKQNMCLSPLPLILWIGALGISATGQTKLAFEVASLKPSDPVGSAQRKAGVPDAQFRVNPNQVDIRAFPLQNLMTFAYQVRLDQIVGLGSISEKKFDVQAKPPEGTQRDQLPAMMRQLLEERFHLVVHRETKRLNIYALVVGKGGLKLKELPPDTPIAMKPSVLPNDISRMDLTSTFAGLASFLTPYVDRDRPVIDMTETPGMYRMVIDVSREEVRTALQAGVAVVPAVSGPDSPPPSATSPYAYAVEQFGLKLEPRTTLTETIVVDHIDPFPVPN